MNATLDQLFALVASIANTTATQPQKYSWTLESTLNTASLVVMVVVLGMKLKKRYDRARKNFEDATGDIKDLQKQVKRLKTKMKPGGEHTKQSDS